MATPIDIHINTMADVRRALEKVRSLNIPRNDLSATATPTSDDDSTQGFGRGSFVIKDSDTAYICVKDLEGAADWIELGSVSGGLPITDLASVGGGAIDITATTSKSGTTLQNRSLNDTATVNFSESNDVITADVIETGLDLTTFISGTTPRMTYLSSNNVVSDITNANYSLTATLQANECIIDLVSDTALTTGDLTFRARCASALGSTTTQLNLLADAPTGAANSAHVNITADANSGGTGNITLTADDDISLQATADVVIKSLTGFLKGTTGVVSAQASILETDTDFSALGDGVLGLDGTTLHTELLGDGVIPRGTGGVNAGIADSTIKVALATAEIGVVTNTDELEFQPGSSSEGLYWKGNAWLRGNSWLRFTNTGNTNYIQLNCGAAISSDVSFTLPSADGAANEFLQTNGAGVLSFSAVDLTADVTGDLPLANLAPASAGFAILAKVDTGGGDYAELNAGASGVLRRSASGDLAFGLVDADNIGSAGPITDGFILTADGAGGSAWEAAPASGANLYDTLTVQAITTANTEITTTKNSVHRPITTSSNLTLTSEPTIAAGDDGEAVIIQNEGTNNLILQDVNVLGGSLLRLESDTETIQPAGSMKLVYNSALGFWVKQYLTNPQDFTPSIASFTVDGEASALTHEWGDGTANDPGADFVASYVGTPSAANAELDGVPTETFISPYLTHTGSAYARGTTAGSTKAWQLRATVAGVSDLLSSTVTITYRAPNYAGESAKSTNILDADLIAFTSPDRQLDTDAYGSFAGLNAGATDYIWFACPSGYTTPNFVISSERAGFTLDATSAHVGEWGKSSTYKKFVSNIQNMGSLTLVTQSTAGGRRIHMGTNTDTTSLTSAEILALSQSVIDTNAYYTGWTTVTSGASDYIWIAYPTDYTDPYVKGSSGERAGFTVKQTAFAHQNQYGYTDPAGYDTMRSDIVNMPDTTYDTQSARPPTKRYIGKAATTGPLSEATIEGLQLSDITESPNGTFASITSIGTGDSVWFCVSNANVGAPSNYGLSISDGSSGYEQAAFTEAALVSVTNQYGYTENYLEAYSNVSELQAVNINNTTSTTWSLKTQAAAFDRRIFMGPHTDSAISSANILTIDDTADGSSKVDSTVAGSYQVTITGSEYLWFCHPNTISDLSTIKDNSTGFAVAGSYRTNVTSHTSDTGETGLTMRVWRSDNVAIFPSGGQVDVT